MSWPGRNTPPLPDRFPSVHGRAGSSLRVAGVGPSLQVSQWCVQPQEVRWCLRGWATKALKVGAVESKVPGVFFLFWLRNLRPTPLLALEVAIMGGRRHTQPTQPERALYTSGHPRVRRKRRGWPMAPRQDRFKYERATRAVPTAHSPVGCEPDASSRSRPERSCRLPGVRGAGRRRVRRRVP